MTVTRATLIARAARRIGARVGTFNSGTSTTAILGGLVGTTGDDTSFNGWRLLMPDATNENDRERRIQLWEDAEGRAHFAARTTDTSLTGETYILVHPEDYALTEFRDALNVACRETSRTYRYAIPLAPNQRVVPLTPLTWLDGAGKVDAAWASDNPNLLHNSDFGLWHEGDALAPDGWTLAGASATVARVTGGLHSAYGASLTRVGADATLTQSIPVPMRQYLTRSSSAPLTPLYAAAWVMSDTASIARIGISNGTTTTYSSYHTGVDDVPQLLTVNYTPTATDTDLALVLSVNTTNGEATFLFAGMVATTGTEFPIALRDAGDSAYREWEVAYSTRNVGGVPVLELLSRTGAQLVTYTRRGFAEMDADADEVDDQYARAVEAGLLAKLLQVRKPNQDRTRLDVIMAEEQRIWNRLTANFNSLPVPKPPARYVIAGG